MCWALKIFAFAIIVYFTFGKLNTPCESHLECLTAFSHCVNNRCICMDEFPQDGQRCKPQAYNCPSKSPLMENGSIKFCTTSNSSSRVCPSGYFCFPHAYEFVDANSDIFIGHCCPVPRSKTPPQAVCPLGTMSKAKCGFATHEYVCGDEEDTFNCVGISGFENSYCCPMPCPYTSRPESFRFRVINGICKRGLNAK